MTYLVESGHLDDALWLADAMIDLAKQMDQQGQKGGWRFSYGPTFTDARAMSGGVAWVLHGLFDVALATKNQTILAYANQKLQEVAFERQITNPNDPRYGLFRAGFGKGQGEDPDFSREEITIEHNWDYLAVLRLAERANLAVGGDAAARLVQEIRSRHALAMEQSEAKLLLTVDRVQAQMERLRREGRLTSQLRTLHEKWVRRIRRLPGQSRWATGMNVQMSPDGKAVRYWDLNLSWAGDNELWSPHGAYSLDRAYHELKNVEAAFLVTLKAKEFSHLPKTDVHGKPVSPEETIEGLRFFYADDGRAYGDDGVNFEDPHVTPTPAFDRMIEPELTWSYIFRLIQFGHDTTDAAQRTWAHNLAIRLIRSQLRLAEIYHGAPYATKDVQDYFNTMLAIASNIHMAIVLTIIRHRGAPSSTYLNPSPSKDMIVGGKRPVRAAQAGMEEKWKSYVGWFVGGALAGGLVWGTYRLGQRSQAPPSPPQVGPIVVMPPSSETRPTPPPPRSQPSTPTTPTLQVPASAIQAVVAPESLTLTFPETLAGTWAVAFLTPAGDVPYPQTIEQVPSEGGAVSFDVPVNPPNRPGWVAAGSRDVVLFQSHDEAVDAAGKRSFADALLHLKIDKDGTVTVKKGTLPRAGAEEISRREFNRALAAGVATIVLAPALVDGLIRIAEAQEIVPNGPIGALAPLRKTLGQDKEIGLIIWDPRDLFRALPDEENAALGVKLLPLAVQAGLDTIWISGYRFRAMDARYQQSIITACSLAGINTVGFIDGNNDWAAKQGFVAQHYIRPYAQ